MRLSALDFRWTLASASPRRLAILRQVGIEPVVLPADVSEVNGTRDPANAAVNNARRKAEAVLEDVHEGILLAADTVVVVDGVSLGKPADDREAVEMLRKLSGRSHEVITGYSLHWIGRDRFEDAFETTRVHMRRLGEAEIERYVATGEPRDKAGAYGIQGAAAAFVDRVEGCYFTVVGLPVARILARVNGWIEGQNR